MLSLTHLLLIGIVVLLIFGPTSIPRLGRTFGHGVREFKKALRDESDIDVTDTVRRLDDSTHP